MRGRVVEGEGGGRKPGKVAEAPEEEEEMVEQPGEEEQAVEEAPVEAPVGAPIGAGWDEGGLPRQGQQQPEAGRKPGGGTKIERRGQD